MTTRGLLDKLDRLDFERIAEQAMDDTAKDFADANRDQLEHGYDRNGERLKKYSNPKYAKIKQQQNSLPGYGNPDLKRSGAFHRGIIMTANNGLVLTGSMDDKAPRLTGKYPTTLGLGGPFKEGYVQDTLAPAIKKEVEDLTGLRFG